MRRFVLLIPLGLLLVASCRSWARTPLTPDLHPKAQVWQADSATAVHAVEVAGDSIRASRNTDDAPIRRAVSEVDSLRVPRLDVLKTTLSVWGIGAAILSFVWVCEC